MSSTQMGLDGIPYDNVQLTGSNAKEATLQNAVAANGNGTIIDVTGQSSLFIQISGTFVGTVNFEATQDNVNYVGILGQNINSGAQLTSATSPGIYAFPVNGLKTFRARISGYTSGNITAKGTALAMPLAALSSATITATVDAVKIKDATGTNTWNIDASGQGPVRNMLNNGSTYDDLRNNTQGTLLASAARTTSPTSSNQTNYNARGVIIAVNVTVASGTGGLQPRVYIQDPVSGNSTPINAAPTAITAVGLYTFVFYPGVAALTGGITQASNVVLPRSWNVFVSHGDTTSYTYSIGYSLIL